MKGIYLICALCIIYLSHANAQNCAGKKIGENIPHPSDCNKYFTCIGGPVERKCPRTLHWNNAKQTCDWPERANCYSFIGLSIKEKFCSAKEDGFYRYPKDCTKGIICYKYKWFNVYSCPPPLWMEVESMACKPAKNVRCDE